MNMSAAPTVTAIYGYIIGRPSAGEVCILKILMYFTDSLNKTARKKPMTGRAPSILRFE
mgnify:CR=1 FL=1